MSVVRYKTNPFLSDLVVNFREKQVRLGALGKDSHVLMNESTGEVQGTHLVTYRRVDAEQLEAMLRPMRQQQGDSMRVMVAGEADASFQYVMTAMSILQRAGINNVSLMSKTGSNAR